MAKSVAIWASPFLYYTEICGLFFCSEGHGTADGRHLSAKAPSRPITTLGVQQKPSVRSFLQPSFLQLTTSNKDKHHASLNMHIRDPMQRDEYIKRKS
jgi:hypothetical protein